MTTREMTIATIEKIAGRIAPILRGEMHLTLASGVESAAADIAEITDPAFWAAHRPRINTTASILVEAECLLLDRLQGTYGFTDEQCDPVRDLMDA